MMSLLIPIRSEDFQRAGRVARVVEIRNIRMLFASFRVSDDDQFSKKNQKESKRGPVDLKVSTKESAQQRDERIRATILFRLDGYLAVGSDEINVIQSRVKLVTDYAVPTGVRITASDLR